MDRKNLFRQREYSIRRIISDGDTTLLHQTGPSKVAMPEATDDQISFAGSIFGSPFVHDFQERPFHPTTLLVEFARPKLQRMPTISFSFLAPLSHGYTQRWIVSINQDFLSQLYEIKVVCRVQEHIWLAGLLQR